MFRHLGRRLALGRALGGIRPGSHVAAAVRAVGSVLLASDCAGCRQAMGWGRFGVCEACWEEVEPWGAESARGNSGRAASPFAALAAYGAYTGRLRDLIHALKFEGRGRLAIPLGRFAAQGVVAGGLASRGARSTIVPVPLSKERASKRGYNQSALIAASLSRELGHEIGRRPPVTRALRKVLDLAPQAGRSRSERLKAPAGAYAGVERLRDRIAGRPVLLVDDVLTTGATAAECSRVLMEMGADEVVVVVVARTRRGVEIQD